MVIRVCDWLFRADIPRDLRHGCPVLSRAEMTHEGWHAVIGDDFDRAWDKWFFRSPEWLAHYRCDAWHFHRSRGVETWHAWRMAYADFPDHGAFYHIFSGRKAHLGRHFSFDDLDDMIRARMHEAAEASRRRVAQASRVSGAPPSDIAIIDDLLGG